jgi:hypothetical protein
VHGPDQRRQNFPTTASKRLRPNTLDFGNMADEAKEMDTGDEGIPIFVSPIAAPLANKKLTKKCLKLVKKGTQQFFVCFVLCVVP